MINQVKFEDIKKSLLELDQEQEDSIEGYLKVFNELRLMKPKRRENEDWMIDIRWVEGEEEEYIDVSMKWLNSDNPEELWAADFTAWEEWLAMKVDEDQVKKFGLIEYITFCLWEMTFDGFDEETINSRKEELESRCEDIDVKNVADVYVNTNEVLKKINDTLGDFKV